MYPYAAHYAPRPVYPSRFAAVGGPISVIGADAPRLTEAQAADPAVKQALRDATFGGAALAGGIVMAALAYDPRIDLAENYLAIIGGAAVILGAGLVFSSRRTA